MLEMFRRWIVVVVGDLVAWESKKRVPSTEPKKKHCFVFLSQEIVRTKGLACLLWLSNNRRHCIRGEEGEVKPGEGGNGRGHSA